MKPQLIIDTDGGVDDALAVIFAASNRDVALCALTTAQGNVGCAQATKNTALVAELAGLPRAVPIYPGCEGPVRGEPVLAEDAHGNDGLGGIWRQIPQRDAQACLGRVSPASAIEGLVRHAPGASVIAVAPLSNLASVIAANPAALAAAKDIVILGGAERGGNITPFAEFNIFADPEAAAAVFSSGLGNITLVTLDLCKTVILTRHALKRASIRAPSRLASFISDIHEHYMNFYAEEDGIDGCYPHDSIAVAAALRPDLFTFAKAFVEVETGHGEQRGRTRFLYDPAGPVSVAVEIEADAFLDHLFETVYGESLTGMFAGTMPGEVQHAAGF